MTNPIRLEGMVEEVASATSLAELKEIWCINQSVDECPPEMTRAYKAAVAKLRNTADYAEPQVVEEVPQPKQVEVRRPVRGSRQYRLLDTNVGWSSTPQVHAVMAIVAAHVRVGEVFDEEAMIGALEANPHVLQTMQGARKVWAYYKGEHALGLMAHGNIEKA